MAWTFQRPSARAPIGTNISVAAKIKPDTFRMLFSFERMVVHRHARSIQCLTAVVNSGDVRPRTQWLGHLGKTPPKVGAFWNRHAPAGQTGWTWRRQVLPSRIRAWCA